jgi:hypothetical protein
MTVETLENGMLKVNSKYIVRLPVGYTRDHANNPRASCTCSNAYGSTMCEHIKAAYASKKV